ncbi:MAG: hypothetical protein WC464_01930 [Bdellovibrionales bacterium]
MRYSRTLLPLACAALVSACSAMTSSISSSSDTVQFWRPISEPNSLMKSDKLQSKLNFDLSQCRCGVFPTNTAHDDAVKFQADKQRLAQTSMTVMQDEEENCAQKPSLVVTECMRYRGWEPTNCSGRMPIPGGGAICAAYKQPASE